MEMEIEIDSKRFRLEVASKPNDTHTPTGEGEEPNGILYHSEGGLSGLLVASAFYNACLRWVSGENIAKKLIYEFLICLTGETQLNRLLKKTACTPETHTPNFEHYYFRVIEEDTKTPATQRVFAQAPPVEPPTKEDRARLAQIQLELLSKSP